VAWGDLEKYLSVGLEYSVVEWQLVDCYALENNFLYPLGNTICASNGSISASACYRVTEGDVTI